MNTDDLLKAYFQQDKILVNHAVESYNDLIDNILENIISQYFP